MLLVNIVAKLLKSNQIKVEEGINLQDMWEIKECELLIIDIYKMIFQICQEKIYVSKDVLMYVKIFPVNANRNSNSLFVITGLSIFAA